MTHHLHRIRVTARCRALTPVSIHSDAPNGVSWSHHPDRRRRRTRRTIRRASRRASSELSRERDQLLAAVDILQEISILAALHARSSSGSQAAWVTSLASTAARSTSPATSPPRSAWSRPTRIRRSATWWSTWTAIPSSSRPSTSGQTVFIPDASREPMLETCAPHARRSRASARSWSCPCAGARTSSARSSCAPSAGPRLFPRRHPVLRNDRLADRARRCVTRIASRPLQRATGDHAERERRAALERIALIAFLRRLLERHATSAEHLWAETLLPRASDEELERLTSVAMQVIVDEADGETPPRSDSPPAEL